MTKLSKNFTLEEMISSSTAQKRGIKNQPGAKEIENLRRLCNEILQPIRDKYGKSIIVTSGYRNNILNKAVGGVSTSQHIRGEAADIISQDNRELWQTIMEMIKDGEIKVGQVINEKDLSWIHISLPKARGTEGEILKL